MSEQLWSDVDSYIGEILVGADDALAQALRSSADAGLPAIALSPPQAKLLHLLARIHGARSILELGTLGGYSTIWLARALPPGGAWSRSSSTPTTPSWRPPTSSARGSQTSSRSASVARSRACAP